MHSNVPYIFYNSQYIEESLMHKEQYCTGTWNVRSMNQGKLEVVKQEMARVKINILGISGKKNEREWVNLIQMMNISIIVGKNPLEEME